MKRLKKELSILLAVAIVLTSISLGFGKIKAAAYDNQPGTGIFRVDIVISTNDCTSSKGTDSSFSLKFLNDSNGVVSSTPDNALSGADKTGDNGGNPLENGQTTSFTYNGASNGNVNETVESLGNLNVNKTITQVQLVNTTFTDDWIFDSVIIYYSPDGGSNWVTLANNSWTNSTANATATWAVSYFSSSSTIKTVTYDTNGGEGGGTFDAIPGQTLTPPFTCTKDGYNSPTWGLIPARMPNTSVSYTATWTPNNYFVSYAGNGSNGGSTISSLHGYDVSKELTLNGYTKTGYLFDGWATSSDGPVVYSDGQSVLNLTAVNNDTVILYAKWHPITYTVAYDGNGSTAGLTPSSNHTYDLESPLTLNVYSRTGYSFAGWSTSSTGSVDYNDGQTIINFSSSQDSTVTLYAKWNANTYTISYNANGGSGSTAASQHSYGTAKALTTNGFFRTGYSFLGWALTNTGNVQYANNESVINLTDVDGAIITLFAKWAPISYTVQYYPNGGSGSTASSTHQYDLAKNLTENNFTRQGYTFAGWNTLANGTGTSYSNNQSVMNLASASNAIIRLYAMWATTQYKITFDANGGTGGNSTYMSYGTTLTAPTVTKPGYTFNGWSPLVPATVPAADSTYTAQWIANTVTVSFDLNGGTGTVPSPQTSQVGNPVTLPEQSNIARTGYNFLGWATSSTATTALSSYTMPVSNTTLYAVWQARQYSITFDANGGTGGTGPTLMAYGSPLTAPQVTRAGYIFTGWQPSVPSTVPAANMTYTAKWSANIVTVSFDLNGGTGTAPTPVAAQEGSSMALPAQGNIAKTGYTFMGWAASSTATTALVSYTMPNANAILYVVWQINQYTITFDANGGTGGTGPALMTYGTQLTAPQVARAGYTFSGWSPAVPSAVPAANATYTAQWTINQYTITFISNGGSAVTSIKSDYGSIISAPNDPTKTGYDFKGWYSDIALTSRVTWPYTLGDSNVTFYAKWERVPVVTFDANGGTFESDNSSIIVVYLYNGMDIHSYIPTATRTGYAFTGWSPAIPETMPSGDMTFTAQWTIRQFTITFDADGGEGGTSGLMDYDAQLTAPVVTKVGYTFKGWSPIVPLTVPAANTTYTAQWSVNSYTITFDANGGIGGTGPVLMTYGSPLTAPVVTRTGYLFAGWLPTVPASVPAQNTTYTAQWSINNITVSFDINGGTGTVPATQTGSPGVPVALPAQGDIIRVGYNFLGWATTSTETVALTNYAFQNTNSTLYAVWSKVPSIQVKPGSTAQIDQSKHFIYGLAEGMTASDFTNNFITISGNGNIVITPSGSFGTGTKIEVVDNATGTVTASYTIIIFGDVNGDGYVTAADESQIRMAASYQSAFDKGSAFGYAADLTQDGIVDLFDLNIIRADTRNIKNINQANPSQ